MCIWSVRKFLKYFLIKINLYCSSVFFEYLMVIEDGFDYFCLNFFGDRFCNCFM